MNTEQLLNDPAAQIGGFWPIVDGYVIPDDQYILYENGKYNHVDILIGINSDEGFLFARPVPSEQYVEDIKSRFGPFADQILEHYPAGEGTTFRSIADLFGDTGFGWHTWTWARMQSEQGGTNVYMYCFDQPQPDLPFIIPVKPQGAVHASEMSYIFKHFDPNTLDQRTEGDYKLSEIMSTYWTNFAKAGDPNGKMLPEWPVYTEGKPTVMYLKTDPYSGPVPRVEELKLLDKYYDWKRSGEEVK
jgi:para-nitrobenzyl esterase